MKYVTLAVAHVVFVFGAILLFLPFTRLARALDRQALRGLCMLGLFATTHNILWLVTQYASLSEESYSVLRQARSVLVGICVGIFLLLLVTGQLKALMASKRPLEE